LYNSFCSSFSQSSSVSSIFIHFFFTAAVLLTSALPTFFILSADPIHNFEVLNFKLYYITMKFSAAIVATFAALAIAAPTAPNQKRAAVLSTKTYDEYGPALHSMPTTI